MALDDPFALRLVHEASGPADEGFIDFDFAFQFAERHRLHGEPDAVQHEPRGLLGHAEPACQFVGADAVLAIGEHPEGGEPLVEPNGRVLKDRPELDGELLLAALALPDAASREEGDFLGLAQRAGRAIGPAELRDEFERGVGVREVADRFDEILRLVGSHCYGLGGHDFNLRSQTR